MATHLSTEQLKQMHNLIYHHQMLCCSFLVDLFLSRFKHFIYFQNVLENLPGVDPQSEAVRSAMGTVTGAQKDKKDEEKKKDEDKK